MTHVSRSPPAVEIDPVGVLAPHLAASEDPIRCAAARALGALGGENAAPALVGALTDPDPDVRSDAMAALARCARPQDAAAIRRSLANDPVADVKVAAIRALCRLGDEAAVALLRALSNDRCEPRVAWERPGEGWDDWLDVQVAAIAALGEMGVEDAVADLVRARSDETGQDLDHPVFGALANLPGRGVEALLDFLGDDDPRVRRRALSALSRSGHGLPDPVAGRLVRDSDSDIRALAIESIELPDEILAGCAAHDPSAFVRRTALSRIAPSRPDVLREALDDPDEGVRATALEAITASPARFPDHGSEAYPGGAAEFAARARAWLRTAGTRLAATCASVLAKLAGADALDALREAAGDREGPPEVRIAALRAMGGIGAVGAIDALRAAIANPSRQVRLAALAAVGELARTAPGDVRQRARDILIDAVRGGPRTAEGPATRKDTGDARNHRRAESERGPSEHPAASPERGRGAGVIPAPRVSGVTGTGEGVGERSFPRSTLEAIRMSSPEAAAEEAQASTPASAAARPPQREGHVRFGPVAVDGCDDVAADIRLAAIRIAAGCPGDRLEAALAEAVDSALPAERPATLEAIALRAESISLSPRMVATLNRFSSWREHTAPPIPCGERIPVPEIRRTGIGVVQPPAGMALTWP